MWGIIWAMCRHGVRFSCSRAAWREDVAVRGRPAPITRRSCFCSVLEVGVGAMRLSLRKRTILGVLLWRRFAWGICDRRLA